MNPPRGRWPSGGFLAVGLTYGLVAAFFLWGFSTPRLDRMWTLKHELKIGEMKRLGKDDRRLLLETLRAHPWVAEEFLDSRGIGLISAESDGWIGTPVATILRTARARAVGSLVFDVQTPRDLMPYRMRVAGAGWSEELEVEAPGVLRLPLPDPPAVAEIIEVRLQGGGFIPDPSVLGLRISFPEKP